MCKPEMERQKDPSWKVLQKGGWMENLENKRYCLNQVQLKFLFRAILIKNQAFVGFIEAFPTFPVPNPFSSDATISLK